MEALENERVQQKPVRTVRIISLAKARQLPEKNPEETMPTTLATVISFSKVRSISFEENGQVLGCKVEIDEKRKGET